MSEQPVAFDRVTGRRFVRAVKYFLTSEVRWQARGLFALLFAFAFSINGLNVLNSYVGRDFITAISHRDQPGFIRQAILYVGVFALSTAVVVLYRFTEERLGLFWRVWLTRRIIGQYFSDRTYLHLKESATVDNPDQRIAEDVRTFTATTLSFTLMFMNGALAVLSFSGVLWTISPFLFGVALGYAVIGTLATIYLGRPLIGLNYRQSDREARFRSDLIHVRENAESIALLRREGRLTARLLRRIDDLGGQLSANRRGEPQPELLHDRVQLPDPNHPDADCGAAVYSREGGIRGHHAIGDGLHDIARRVLAHHQPVPVHLIVRRRDRTAKRAGRRRRERGAIWPDGGRRGW